MPVNELKGSLQWWRELKGDNFLLDSMLIGLTLTPAFIIVKSD
jgi:hypothetical protein